MLAILRRILLSPLLRLVWTVLLVGALSKLLRWVAPTLAQSANVTLPGAIRNAVLFTLTLALSARFLEGRRLRDVGFRPAAALPDTVRGFALGAGLLTSLIGVLAALGCYRIVGWEPLEPEASRGGVFLSAVAVFFAVAIFEEVLSRGILFRLFEQALGTWLAIAISAGLFALGHRSNPGATLMSGLGVAQAGVLLAAAYAATRSLWFVIGVHWAWNVFEGPVWGSPVSGIDLNVLTRAVFPGPVLLTGGSFGVEQSLPLIVLGGVVSVAFLVMTVRRGQILTPRWMRWLLEKFRAPPAALPPSPSPAQTTSPSPDPSA
jgi:uncharacterized protein